MTESTFEKEVTNDRNKQRYARRGGRPFGLSLITAAESTFAVIVLRVPVPAERLQGRHNRRLSRDMDYVFV
jgi:hypothetical protein